LFPEFSKSWQYSGKQGLSQAAMKALRMASFISIPIAAACFVFHRSLLSIIFQHGAFSGVASNETSGIFGLLLICGPAAVVLDYFQKLFYAAQRMWLPTAVLGVSIGGLSLAIETAAKIYGITGVSLIAMSLPCLQMILLAAVFSKIGGDMSFFGLARYAAAVGALALVWTAVGGIAKKEIEDVLGSSSLVAAISVSSALMISLLGFGASSIVLRLPEALRSIELISRKGRPVSGNGSLQDLSSL
jgi:peptidoglycan biosynthesis protein MviN/MurJ (putative lipid II flippase)